MKEFKVGDEVIILSCGHHKTVIESIEPMQRGNFAENGYWSKNANGELLWCFADEMKHAQTK